MESIGRKCFRFSYTSVWLPPAYKGTGGGYDVGYGVYDIFDLGEFDQKSSVRTKYGTKEEYVNAIATAKEAGIRTYADVVLNHKMGGDKEEEVEATPFNPDDRHQLIGDLQKITTCISCNFSRESRFTTSTVIRIGSGSLV